MSSEGHGNGEEVWSNNHGNNNNNDVVVWRNDEATGPSGHFSSPELQSPPVPLYHHHQPQLQPLIFLDDDVGFDYQSPVQSRPRRFIFSHQNSEVKEIIDDSEASSPLHLTLKKSESFINLLEQTLSDGRMSSTSNTRTQLDLDSFSPRPVSSRSEDYGSQPMSEKLKASNFPALLLRIGTWERISKHEGDLVAKCYYAKKKLVWEILEGALKSKIEIQWTDIVGIRATIAEDEPGLLEIELDKEPSYYRETNPQPRKHTLWQQTKDFTDGQAAKFRIHHVRFAPGVLDKHYEKLLQCHPKLKELSQEPFPSKPILYFEEERVLHGFPDFDFNGIGTPYFRQMPYLNLPQPVPQAAFRIFDSNSQMPVNNMMMDNGRRMYWGETSHGNQAPRPPLVLPSAQVNNFNFRNNNNVGPSNNANMGPLSCIENHLLNDNNQTTFSDESMPMHPLFDHLQMANSRIGGQQQVMQPDLNVAPIAHSHWNFGQEVMMQEAPIHSPQTSSTNLTYPYTYPHPMHACYMHEGFSNHII